MVIVAAERELNERLRTSQSGLVGDYERFVSHPSQNVQVGPMSTVPWRTLASSPRTSRSHAGVYGRLASKLVFLVAPWRFADTSVKRYWSRPAAGSNVICHAPSAMIEESAAT